MIESSLLIHTRDEQSFSIHICVRYTRILNLDLIVFNAFGFPQPHGIEN